MLIFAVSMILKALFMPTYHAAEGTYYHDHAIASYVHLNHGPDGKLFLDPCFIPEIESLDGCKVLDIGCGAAPWSIYAAKNKGEVYALDIQEKMIKEAKVLINKENVVDKIKLIEGDAAKLPFEDQFFDKALSICLTCNLTIEAFKKHFQECYRSVKDNGTIIIGTPISLDTVFTNGSKTAAETYLHIYETLASMPDNPSPELIMNELNKLTEVTSATFYIADQRLKLVVNEKDISSGTPIWRKLHCMVIPNRFYTKNDYFHILNESGFEILSVEEPCFTSEQERLAYNQTAVEKDHLGENYVTHAPFLTIKARKKPFMSTIAKN